jgi:hypothetical protein
MKPAVISTGKLLTSQHIELCARNLLRKLFVSTCNVFADKKKQTAGGGGVRVIRGPDIPFPGFTESNFWRKKYLEIPRSCRDYSSATNFPTENVISSVDNNNN